jgi:hypothetical protein
MWADAILLSHALMRIQEMMAGPGPAATRPIAAGTDWLQAYA